MAPPIHAGPAAGSRPTEMALIPTGNPLRRLFGKTALQRSYDTVAEEYSRRLYQELDNKPADRQLLDKLAAALKESGPCVDLGCGPGHVTRYLHEHGVDISGIDLSDKMVKQARKLNPGIRFARGDMRALKVADDHWSAIVALYSLIHIPPAELLDTLLEFQRVLEPGGALLIAFHVGQGTVHLEDWWEHKVELDFYHHRTLDVLMLMQQAGFAEVSTYQRDPYPDEAQTRRAYILAEVLPGVPPARRSAASNLA
ncbi:MAG: class I SAM-dependent methyltransferase [Halieaceae bacterium]